MFTFKMWQDYTMPENPSCTPIRQEWEVGSISLSSRCGEGHGLRAVPRGTEELRVWEGMKMASPWLSSQTMSSSTVHRASHKASLLPTTLSLACPSVVKAAPPLTGGCWQSPEWRCYPGQKDRELPLNEQIWSLLVSQISALQLWWPVPGVGWGVSQVGVLLLVCPSSFLTRAVWFREIWTWLEGVHSNNWNLLPRSQLSLGIHHSLQQSSSQHGPQTSNICITWNLIGTQILGSLPRQTEPETLGEGPSQL